jgi:[ribosomal protein S18]-alanine N-acetyltransferase
MIEITPMTPQDLTPVVEIERSSHLEPWSEAAFRSELGKECAYACVAREGRPGGDVSKEVTPCDLSDTPEGDDLKKRVVGYICFWVLLDEVHILNVTVDASCRRRGYGKVLLLHALNLGCSLGARTALLEVRASNVAALALYHQMGFARVGERPNYYGVLKEPAVVMKLHMDDAWQRTRLENSIPAC